MGILLQNHRKYAPGARLTIPGIINHNTGGGAFFMLKIYLCEDSKPQLDTLENTIQKYLFINHSNGKIVCKTQNPMELLSYLHAAPSYLGLYYLDVEFDCQFDGFSLAQKIREIDPRGYIVFITVHHSLSIEPYRHHIEALDFIWKEDMHMKSRITQSLQKALDNYGHCMGPVLKKEHLLLLRTGSQIPYSFRRQSTLFEWLKKYHIPVE